MNAQQMVRDIQIALGVPADGICGPFTIAAIHEEIIHGKKPAPEIDDRSAMNISTLNKKLQSIAKEFVIRCKKAGLGVKIICGLRSYSEQAELFAKGRSQPGPRVTNAGPGQSMHNFGLAFDIGIFVDGKYLPESPQYASAAAIGRDLGLKWGGNFQTIKDEPHFELTPQWADKMPSTSILAELRRRKEVGTDALA